MTAVTFKLFVTFILFYQFLKLYGLEFIPERAAITICNPKYMKEAMINVRRYTRRSIYYVNIDAWSYHTWGNNVTVQIVFYEYLHNEYRRSFVEMNYKMCDFVLKDVLIGALLRKVGYNVCPVPAGRMFLPNLTLVSIPAVDNMPYKWPFEKGKAVATFRNVPQNETLVEGYIIATFKESVKRKQKP